MKLDKFDAQLLQALQRDGRRTVVELAAEVGLSATPCHRRIKNMETDGVIESYTVVLNPKKIGLQAQAMVQIRLERHTDEIVSRFKKELNSLDEIIYCVATTGTHDFLLHVVAEDLDALSNVVLKKLLKIPGVRDLHSSVVLDIVKRTARLPLDQIDR